MLNRWHMTPITLLSILRKILASCLCKRTGDRIDKEIPIQQAAYRPGRSTTEHVFATKLIIEKITASQEETARLLIIDMSKAFDLAMHSIMFSKMLKTGVSPILTR